MKKLILLFLLLISFNLNAQDFGTKGNEFWLTYMENLDLTFNGDPQFSVFVSAEESGTATLLAPVTGFTVNFSYTANEVTEYILPSALFYAEGSENIENLGLKISTETETNIFAIHYRRYFTEATVLLPTQTLGDEYLVSAAFDFNGSIGSPSSFVILATEDNTEVEITPTALTLGLRPAGVPFMITLNAGQIYQVQAIGDLTGTKIKTTTGEKVAVFGGALKGFVSCGVSADNHLYDQLYPISAAATSYALIPFKDQGISVFKILAMEDDTEVSINGNLVATLAKGTFREELLDTPKILTTSKSVQVSQFNPSQLCTESQVGDPSMLQLCPIENRIRKMQFENLTGFGDFNNMFVKRCLTLFTETENTSNVSLDGQTVEFELFPDYPNYSFAEVELESGTSKLLAPQGVLAFAYGFGDFDAYTYHLGFDAAMSTSYEEISRFDYSISPNPSTDRVRIEVDAIIDQIQLFDMQGKLIQKEVVNSNSTSILLTDLVPSVYLLKIKIGAEIITEKIIKF